MSRVTGPVFSICRSLVIGAAHFSVALKRRVLARRYAEVRLEKTSVARLALSSAKRSWRMNTPGNSNVQSMEDILDDIRRKAADRRVSPVARGDRSGAVVVAGDEDVVALNDDIVVPDVSDLPSIIRNGGMRRGSTARNNITELRPARGSRLMQALGVAGRSIAGVSAVAVHESAAVAHPEPAAELSGANGEAIEAPSADHAATGGDRALVAEVTVSREMVSFLDTRMRRMGACEQPAQVCATADEACQGDALALVTMEQAHQLRNELAIACGLASAASEVECERPGLPDSAAELLRPMLRQWIADNMPRIVEQALHMELAENVASGKGNS